MRDLLPLSAGVVLCDYSGTAFKGYLLKWIYTE